MKAKSHYHEKTFENVAIFDATSMAIGCGNRLHASDDDSCEDCLYLDIIIPTSLYFNEKKGISLN